MCDFTPEDEVVCVNATVLNLFPHRLPNSDALREGAVYTVGDVSWDDEANCSCLHLVEVKNGPPWDEYPDEGFWSFRFRKVDRRNDRLSIEAFLTMKPGFEEPRRAPAKKRERVQ